MWNVMGNKKDSYKDIGNKATPRKTCLLLIKGIMKEHKQTLVSSQYSCYCSYLISLEIASPWDCMGLKGTKKQRCLKVSVIFERLYLSGTPTISATKGSLFPEGEGKGKSTKSQVQTLPV